jgi:hypothetical protein
MHKKLILFGFRHVELALKKSTQQLLPTTTSTDDKYDKDTTALLNDPALTEKREVNV